MSAIKRMLVPTDFSVTSDLAVDYAAELARRVGASIHLMHVIEEPAFTGMYPEGSFADLPGLRTRMIKEARRHFSDSIARCASVQVTTDIQFGRPAHVIGEQASVRGTDLIVMGTHGRGAVAHLFLGSVAERVVRTAPCPVLTVRDTVRVADSLAAEAQTAQLRSLVTK